MKRSEFDKLKVGDVVYVVVRRKHDEPAMFEGFIRDKMTFGSSVRIHYFTDKAKTYQHSMMVGISSLLNKADAYEKYTALKAQYDKTEAEINARAEASSQFNDWAFSVERPFRKSGVSVTVAKETIEYRRKEKLSALFNVEVTAEELQRVVEFVQSIRGN